MAEEGLIWLPKCLGVTVSTTAKGKILHVGFEDWEGKKYDWVPTWDAVRMLFERACVTEMINQSGFVNEELKEFKRVANFTHTLIVDAEAMMETGEPPEKQRIGVQYWRQRLIEVGEATLKEMSDAELWIIAGEQEGCFKIDQVRQMLRKSIEEARANDS